MVRASLIAVLLVAAPSWAEGFAVRASVTPSEVELGKTFQLNIEITRPEGERVILAAPPEGDKVRAAGPVARELKPAGDGRVVEVIRVPLLALDTQEVETPELVLKTPSGEALVVAPQKVNVVDMRLGDPDTFKEPEPAAEMLWFSEFDRRPVLAIGVLALFPLGLLLGFLWGRRRRSWVAPEVPKARAPIVPIDVRALARLDALVAEGLLQKDAVAEFVQRLMDEVLRFYLEGRFELSAERSTTTELAQSLLSVEEVDAARLTSILNSADLVKFARADLRAQAATKMAAEVRHLIEETRA